MQGIEFAIMLFFIIAAAASFLFLTIPATGATYTHFEGEHHSRCTSKSLELELHSFARGHVPLHEIKVPENNASCTAPVDYLILNTKTTIKCTGEFTKGEAYTVLFDGKGIRVRC